MSKDSCEGHLPLPSRRNANYTGSAYAALLAGMCPKPSMLAA